MAVTERGALTCWPSVAPRPGRGKSWVLAMLAPKRGLRVAPVPPRAADLTRSKPGARGMPGRDEGTGPLIEPRNHQKPAAPPCCQDHPSLTVAHPMVGETEHASHTGIRTLPSTRLYSIPDLLRTAAAISFHLSSSSRLFCRRPSALQPVTGTESEFRQNQTGSYLRAVRWHWTRGCSASSWPSNRRSSHFVLVVRPPVRGAGVDAISQGCHDKLLPIGRGSDPQAIVLVVRFSGRACNAVLEIGPLHPGIAVID
jgi:hypothetical protein